MNYKEYIELGFTRHDLQDSIEINCSGYNGYYLKYKLNKKTSIQVYYDELQNPRLFIKKNDNDFCYIIGISVQQVLDILTKK